MSKSKAFIKEIERKNAVDFFPFQINNINLNWLSSNSLLLNKKDSKFWLVCFAGKANNNPLGVILDEDSITPQKPVGKGEFSISVSPPFLKMRSNIYTFWLSNKKWFLWILANSTGVIDILGSSSIILLFGSLLESTFVWLFEETSLKHHMFKCWYGFFILFICSVKSDISDCCIVSELNDIIFSIGLGFLSTHILFPIYILNFIFLIIILIY